MQILVILTEIFVSCLGTYPLVLYCLRTLTCGIYEKHPHYHCQTRSKIMSLGHKGDKSFELAFAISEVFSRSIFLLFCCKSLKKRNKSPCRNFWRQFKLSQTWILFGTWFLCEVRFIAILTDPKDLGQHKIITEATIVIYMFDALLTSLLVTFLSFARYVIWLKILFVKTTNALSTFASVSVKPSNAFLSACFSAFGCSILFTSFWYFSKSVLMYLMLTKWL